MAQCCPPPFATTLGFTTAAEEGLTVLDEPTSSSAAAQTLSVWAHVQGMLPTGRRRLIAGLK